MAKSYIDAEKLIAKIKGIIAAVRAKNRPDVFGSLEQCMAASEIEALNLVIETINELQQEQPMPDSTKLIELWHEDKEMLKEKDFRNDPWRLAYNAFMCGFGRGIAVNRQERPEMDLEKVVEFECVGKKVKMTIQELINYYIDSECCDVADECGF